VTVTRGIRIGRRANTGACSLWIVLRNNHGIACATRRFLLLDLLEFRAPNGGCESAALRSRRDDPRMIFIKFPILRHLKRRIFAARMLRFRNRLVQRRRVRFAGLWFLPGTAIAAVKPEK